ncbi:hypothetical protein BpHYR1_038479 [Brachionus plicatilis]|uniref:Uncharacterized protein n=1 Tax=Brachionus plicatilis TaxID=10195 RepID=A0A3M7R2X3_BRAPC|nr:hypothetical protein BpHYR1_038479 [Brachionus plicatilis]
MNERITFNLIFDKNSNKCDKKNGPNKQLISSFFNCNSNKNELIVFMLIVTISDLNVCLN